ncbi:MAG: HAD-IA family hydrolase [Bacteroidales bacterium]|nr:HAD-IA family hydrolase [Bacteroidales bacterium]MBR7035873.1 HAD-IA family hydrolase [Bacteroidales bacterium]
MKQYSTIIFDLDGTLMDTLVDISNSVNYALSELGLPIRTIDEIRTFVGNGVRELMRCALQVAAQECCIEYSEQLLDSSLELFRKHYVIHCQDCTKPYDGIFDVLRCLKTNGYKMAIVSNKPQREVAILHSNYFSQWIDVAYGENESAGIRKKPFPDMVYKAIDDLCEDRYKCVYIGDSETDLATAKQAGVDCISVLWGFRSKEVLEQCGATMFAHSPSDLLALLSIS